MAFQAQFIRFRSEDNHPTPVGLPAQVVALTADEAMQKLRRLVADESGHPQFTPFVCSRTGGRSTATFARSPRQTPSQRISRGASPWFL